VLPVAAALEPPLAALLLPLLLHAAAERTTTAAAMNMETVLWRIYVRFLPPRWPFRVAGTAARPVA
jgi:hypothetical protein